MVYSDPRFEIILIHNVTAYYFNQCCILVKHNFFNLYYKNHNWLKEAENAKDNLINVGYGDSILIEELNDSKPIFNAQ